MLPYYEQDGIAIYHADCRDVLPTLEPVDLVLTDPPYGIGAALNLRANTRRGNALCASSDYGFADWDDTPPDPDTMDRVISAGAKAIVWGGNYYQLGRSSCWLVWDKETGTNYYADAELAWTNLDGAVRLMRHQWKGMFRASDDPRTHPTQKPEAVMLWCLSFAPGSVLDPFMGSGTTLVAAKQLGRKAIGIEIEERYCEIAAQRLAQGVLDLHAEVG